MRVHVHTGWLSSMQEWTPLLSPLGVETGRWPHAAVSDNPSPEAILAAYTEPLNELKTRRAYTTQDVVTLTPDNPNLDTILKPFEAPHYHTDDEVRVCVGGEGIFKLYTARGGAPEHEIAIWVEPQDLIVLPAYLMHSFHLTDKRDIRAIRIFKDNPKWEAHYEWPVVGQSTLPQHA